MNTISMRLLLIPAFLVATCHVHAAGDSNGLIRWQGWTADLFERAKREQRFVILDLEAVWCHWCHVMEETTYAEPKVAELIRNHYIAVRVDQDANPDLSTRYGDWGWPATIVFAPDGTEIVKRRGYIPPVFMISLLQAIVDDPSPGPSVVAEPDIEPAAEGTLSRAQREQLEDDYWKVYDRENGGWGNVHKFVDLASLQYALHRAQRGSRVHELMARQTLNQSLYLIDPEWGGIYQYSDQQDWRSPHYEKIMLTQATAIRAYSAAHQLWGAQDSRYIDAARAVGNFLLARMRAPAGPFYTSQDADVDRDVPGKVFYNLGARQREKLGRAPRIDRNHYTRENAWVIRALLALHDAESTTESANQWLDAARQAAQWILEKRAMPGGGFAHGDNDRGGPFVGDNAAAADAFIAMYASTGEREWLNRAVGALDFIDKHLRASEAGYLTHPVPAKAAGVFAKQVVTVEDNVAVARAANRLRAYTGKERFAQMAERAMRFLASPSLTENRLFLHGVLLTAEELAHEPIHITVVGRKDDPSAAALHQAARAYPGIFKRVDWWDRSEGPLPNPDIRYPELDRAAAFACSENTCSLPAFEPDKLGETVTRLLKPVSAAGSNGG